MKFGSFKHMLQEVAKTKEVIVTISVWTHNSKRMTFRVPFRQLERKLDKYMEYNFGYGKGYFQFTDTSGNKHKFHESKLRIVKFDHVEFFKGGEKTDHVPIN